MAELSRRKIRDTIRFLGDFTNVRKFPDADINKEIQRGFDKFWLLVDKTHEGWWDKQDNVITVASQAYIALPSDCWRAHTIDLQDGSDFMELRKVPREQRNRYGTTTGKPTSYRLSSRGIELYPTPDAAYTLRVDYSPKPPTLKEDELRDWYTGWEDFVIAYTKLQLARRERMPLNEYLDELKMAGDALTESAHERDTQEPEYLTLREFDSLNLLDDGLW